MNKYLLIISGLLLLLAAVLFVRILQYKRQMRIFAEKLNRRLKEEVDQSIHVEYFDKDILALANALNHYSDNIREKNLELERDRTRLKNVIAGISHDFRTPLTSAKGYLQLMKKSGNISGKDAEYLDIALSKTDYLRVLSDAFFEVSSADAKDDEIEIAELDVTRLLTSLCLEQYEWIRESGIKVSFDIPETELMVKSNETMLGRIFSNFFSNARKYASTFLNVRLMETDRGIIVEFENDAEQIKDVDVSLVFDAFYRGASRSKEGAGLGLYIVKCLADKLGHEVDARVSDSRFVIRLTLGTGLL